MSNTKFNKKSYNQLELWLLSDRGKGTINRFYSWGAAFVILGALFKFLGWPYANGILFFSMMTEVLVFFISGFEPQIEHSGTPPSLSNKDRECTLRLDEDIQSHYTQELQDLTESISELKKEHERMTRHLIELNAMYSRMLAAMQQTQHPQEK